MVADGINFAHERDAWWDHVNTVMNPLSEKPTASQARLCSMAIIRKQGLHGGVLMHLTHN
jgi:hypothetical protein